MVKIAPPLVNMRAAQQSGSVQLFIALLCYFHHPFLQLLLQDLSGIRLHGSPFLALLPGTSAA